jgi:Complex 1 protein (LYR family)
MKKLSGLQLEVLALYRTLLREASKKDAAGIASSLSSGKSFVDRIHTDGTSLSYAKREFRKQALEVKRSDFKTIEYKMRKAQKQIKVLQMPGVKVVGGTW